MEVRQSLTVLAVLPNIRFRTWLLEEASSVVAPLLNLKKA